MNLNMPPKKILYHDDAFYLLIRPLEESDAACLNVAIAKSIKILHPFLDWSHEEWSLEKQAARLHKAHDSYYLGDQYEFGIFSFINHDFLMSASLSKGKTANIKTLEIGYWTSLDHCRKGLGTLVAKILIIVAFDVIKADRVEARCRKLNAASKKIIQNCGFQFEGLIRNYFNLPSIKMIKNGFSLDRDCLQYGLIPEDIRSLFWYSEIKRRLDIFL